MTVTTFGSNATHYGGGDLELVRRGISSPAESGFVVSRQTRSSAARLTGRKETRSWTVYFGPLSQAEYDDVLTSWRSACGAALPILWTPPPPDDVQIPVRCLNDTLRVQKSSGPKYEIEMTYEEVT